MALFQYSHHPSKMIEFVKLMGRELEVECQKEDLEVYGHKEMIAALKSRYKSHPLLHDPQRTRDSSHDLKNRWRKDNYHYFYHFQLKVECVERKLELDHSEGKAELINKLLRDDERLLHEELNSLIINKDSDLENGILRFLEFYGFQTRVRLTSEKIVFEHRLASDKMRFKLGLDSKDSDNRNAFDLHQNNSRTDFRAQQEAIKTKQYDEARVSCRKLRNEAFAARAHRAAQETEQCEQATM
jgi:hypothetical protein